MGFIAKPSPSVVFVVFFTDKHLLFFLKSGKHLLFFTDRKFLDNKEQVINVFVFPVFPIISIIENSVNTDFSWEDHNFLVAVF